MLLGLIDTDEMFKFFRAIVDSLPAEGRLRIGQDISHLNPYVEIGKHMLPEDDNSREIATQIDAVKTLEDIWNNIILKIPILSWFAI